VDLDGDFSIAIEDGGEEASSLNDVHRSAGGLRWGRFDRARRDQPADSAAPV